MNTATSWADIRIIALKVTPLRIWPSKYWLQKVILALLIYERMRISSHSNEYTRTLMLMIAIS